MKYPNKLKEYRQLKGVRQQDIVDLLGIKGINRLSRWEAGIAMPNVPNAMKLARIFGVEIQDIYDIELKQLNH